MTFSIVAHDPRNGDLGVAVQSKFLAVGAAVPWARAGVGAIATQAYANLAYGPQGLEHLAGGATAQEAVDALTAADEGRALRQVGIVDAQGRAASYTGAKCTAWAGGVVPFLVGSVVKSMMALATTRIADQTVPRRGR